MYTVMPLFDNFSLICHSRNIYLIWLTSGVEFHCIVMILIETLHKLNPHMATSIETDIYLNLSVLSINEVNTYSYLIILVDTHMIWFDKVKKESLVGIVASVISER